MNWFGAVKLRLSLKSFSVTGFAPRAVVAPVVQLADSPLAATVTPVQTMLSILTSRVRGMLFPVILRATPPA